MRMAVCYKEIFNSFGYITRMKSFGHCSPVKVTIRLMARGILASLVLLCKSLVTGINQASFFSKISHEVFILNQVV